MAINDNPPAFDDELMQILATERALDIRQSSLRLELLEVCVEKLEDTQRALVTSIYIDGMDVGAVANQQGRAAQTIYNKLTFIRRVLAECVQQRLTEATL